MIEALIAGGASLLGGLMGNSASAKQAQATREWQEELSNTAHQREVKDLRAAGLNPILSVNRSGASTPAGATAQQSDPITPAVNSALAANKNPAEKALLEQQANSARSVIYLNDQLALKAQADADLSKSAADLNRIEANNRGLTAQNIPLTGENLKASTAELRSRAMLQLSQDDLNRVNQLLARSNIRLTDSQNAAVLQTIAKNVPAEMEANILAKTLDTAPAKAAIILERYKQALPNLGDILKIPNSVRR